MKHTLQVTLMLVFLFLFSQIIGLFIINHYLAQELPFNIQKPQFHEKLSFIQIFSIIIVTTLVALIIIKLNLMSFWKFWFFISVWFCLLLALSVIFTESVALIISLFLAYLKLKRNIFIHNLTELLIYGGLASIFVGSLKLLPTAILLVLISIYDAIAVWKTKHMITLAKFQTKSKLFAGLLIPYAKNKVAILGGGDMGFPLIFTGVLLKDFGIKAFIAPFILSIVLLFLLIYSKKEHYYPAMPFIATGCFISYLIMLI